MRAIYHWKVWELGLEGVAIPVEGTTWDSPRQGFISSLEFGSTTPSSVLLAQEIIKSRCQFLIRDHYHVLTVIMNVLLPTGKNKIV